LPTAIFIVEDPAPVIEEGVNVALFWLPSPVADNAIAELNPPVTVDVMVTFPEPLRAILIDVGDTPMENPATVPFTVSEIVVVSTVPSIPVPVTVTLDVPIVALELAVNVKVELPFPDNEVGLKLAVTPAGRPDAENDTAEL